MTSYTGCFKAALNTVETLVLLAEATGRRIFGLVAVAPNSWHVASLRTLLLFRPHHSHPQRRAQIYTHYAILPGSSLHGAAAVLRSHGAMR